MPQDISETWGALLRCTLRWSLASTASLQETHGLPLTWYDVLLSLNTAPERRLTMGRTGSVAAVSRTRVSRVVDEMVRAGLVAREPNPEDGRSAFATLTSAGRVALRKAAPTASLPWSVISPTTSPRARARSWHERCEGCWPRTFASRCRKAPKVGLGDRGGQRPQGRLGRPRHPSHQCGRHHPDGHDGSRIATRLRHGYRSQNVLERRRRLLLGTFPFPVQRNVAGCAAATSIRRARNTTRGAELAIPDFG